MYLGDFSPRFSRVKVAFVDWLRQFESVVNLQTQKSPLAAGSFMFRRTSQIRTGDLYHVNIDGCTNVHSSTQILTLDASIESFQQQRVITRCDKAKRTIFDPKSAQDSL